MTNIDPAHRLTTTFTTDDLAELASGPPPFATIVLPIPSHHDDAEQRFSIRWQNARRRLEQADWPSDRVSALDGHLAEINHDAGVAVVLVQNADGAIFTEYLTIGVDHERVTVGDVPALVPVVEHRQRTLPHIVIDADRAGADIIAFDGGAVVGTEQVEGDTTHIHRGHPGGWSQRRFQQRAENTWERNADDVADAVEAVAKTIEPVLVAVAGEVRASTLIVESLADRPLAGHPEVVALEAGDAGGIAEETLRLLSDLHARRVRDVLDSIRSGSSTLTESDAVSAALGEGRVDVLLVNDRAVDDDTGSDAVRPVTTVDSAVAAALKTSASVLVAPTAPELRDGLAAITRW